MNKIFKLTVILFLVCAIVAGVLGIVYNITSGPIAQQQKEKTIRAYNAVMKSDGFTAVPAEKYADSRTINLIEKADNGAGYVVNSTFSGAQGSITMVVGVDNDLKCTGISIISHSETSGLGAVAASASAKGEAFRASFIGKAGDLTVSDIDAISGATITSKAVTNAVAASIAAVEALG